MPRRPFDARNCASNHLAAASSAPWSVACFSALRRSSGELTGTSRPASRASRSTASGKGKPSLRMTKPTTSPWAPQPKQWKKFLSSLTVNEGVFSLWKGQRPVCSRPRFCSRTRRPTTWEIDRRFRSSSTNSGGMPMPQRHPVSLEADLFSSASSASTLWGKNHPSTYREEDTRRGRQFPTAYASGDTRSTPIPLLSELLLHQGAGLGEVHPAGELLFQPRDDLAHVLD